MLKALELVGFKSFADKTRFEFSRGITAVVGPNGSGKSNIVDAIKWVLGEQSVKSLRGKEMADVIFNGSGTRGALNAAETTLTFDNSHKLLPLDSPEVHVTRRVYRSGEGEYLINKQPCRLRDIREMFAGTGIGIEAYSVIEQGKVDVLLQSSPRERRVIFEEAAGISRFKAKKLETLRRLERVDQNLLRLSDIVGEVESRLRSVRLQASKARRYKEHVDRLQQLRTTLGRADWQQHTTRLAEISTEIERLQATHGQNIAEAEQSETATLACDTSLAAAEAEIRACDSRAAGDRERLATAEATIAHWQAHSTELEEELSRHRGHVAAMSLRAGDLRQQLDETLGALAAAEDRHRQLEARAAADAGQLDLLLAEAETAHAAAEQARTELAEKMRRAGSLSSEISGLQSQAEAAQAAAARARRRLDELQAGRQQLDNECRDLKRLQAELAARVDERHGELAAAQSRLAKLRQEHASLSAQVSQMRQRQAGASERASVLEELESRAEGVGAGVKQVLAEVLGSDNPQGWLRGLVADLFEASVENAPLVDLALGERAQHLVVDNRQELLNFLGQAAYQLRGRVGFISAEPPELPPIPDLTSIPYVLGRADQLVTVDATLRPLAEWLLGRTWVVDKLDDALALHRIAGHGAQVITLAGELVSSEGSISVGPRQGALGLISRRSELRALRDLLADLESHLATAEARLAELDQAARAEDDRIDQLLENHQRAVQLLTEHRLRVHAAETRLQQLDEQRTALEDEIEAADRQSEASGEAITAARRQLESLESEAAEQQARLADMTSEAARLDSQRQALAEQMTAWKVDSAQSDERLRNLRSRRLQCERDQQERQQSMAEGRQQLEQCADRLRTAQRAILQAESAAALLYLSRQQGAAEMGELATKQAGHRNWRTELAAQAARARAAARELEESQHARELDAQQIRLERTNLAARLQEDYAIDLAAAAEGPPEAGLSAELPDRASAEQEIAELRRKLNNLGNVNLEALAELDELESRFASLEAQHRDLVQAKQHLDEIIGRINTDSRRLFSETLEAVKENFQNLFRKLFGGGQADVVLEEGVDILDSGIEIIARPPGKQPRNISLLSGGEKTLTCVALLLAIFQYRPSPFCVLDEVDAALDEANIERFIGVLQEFLAWTQFVVVTHSKKTMTCASTLYGVTMQESGISKRVSVRFEDVSETGDFAVTGAAEPGGDDEQAA
ncbi:MAG TPA: chromosome segregation protein SMC [Pirellulales bacterium]|jgi:chromosome segregation protein|nr:chromosome segregation protein SMC [Pirellulales bacterium]